MDYAVFFAGMLAMALFGGLIAFLIIRPWLRPMRRGWESSHEIITENYRLSAAQIRRQTAEEQNGANQAAIATEQTRSRLIQAQGENNQADAEEKVRAIQAEIAVENARVRLIEVQAENDQLEIKRRAALRRAGINPDALSPRQVKRRLLIVLMVTIGLFIIAIVIRIYFSK